MNGASYKGFLIRPASLPLATGEWSLEVHIEKHRDDSVTNRKFFANDTFKTEEEAVKHCINFGKLIIDGKAEGLSITDL